MKKWLANKRYSEPADNNHSIVVTELYTADSILPSTNAVYVVGTGRAGEKMFDSRVRKRKRMAKIIDILSVCDRLVFMCTQKGSYIVEGLGFSTYVESKWRRYHYSSHPGNSRTGRRSSQRARSQYSSLHHSTQCSQHPDTILHHLPK